MMYKELLQISVLSLVEKTGKKYTKTSHNKNYQRKTLNYKSGKEMHITTSDMPLKLLR